MTPPLHVLAAGAVTALGHDAERTVASLRSGLDRFKQVPFLGAGGADLVIAPIEGYADGTSAVDRYEALALKAILPCIHTLTAGERLRLQLFVGLPMRSRPGVPPRLAHELGVRLSQRLQLPAQAVHFVELGRVSVLAALAQVRQLLVGGDTDAQCVVGGVDVLVNPHSLRGLSAAQQLKEQWDGFIPGEAAAFVRVALKAGAGHWGGAAAAVRGIGLTRDPAAGSAADPLVGVGVCEAYRAAVRDAEIDESVVRFYVNDVNGARAGFEDAAMGHIRFSRTPKGSIELWHVASHLGETGAAIGALELIWASAAHELGFAADRHAMLAAAQDTYRAAVLMTAEAAPPLPSPRHAIGRGVPVLHAAADAPAARAADVRALRLTGEDLHGELLAQNFGELGWLWSVRHQHHQAVDQVAWADIEAFEQRLVTQLDAIGWAGAAGRRLAIDRLQSPEPDDLAAAASVLLSFADAEATSALFEAIGAAPDSLGAVAAVALHMPAPAADPLIRRLLSSERPAWVAAGLRCLAGAGRLDDATARAAARSRAPEVVAALVDAAGSAGLASLWPIARARVEETFGSPRGHVELLAYAALTPPDDSDGSSLRAMLVQAAPAAAALLCLRDQVSFCDLVTACGNWDDPITLDAAGWSGEPFAIPRLLSGLESGEPAQALAAGSALHRLTGLVPTGDEPPAVAWPAVLGRSGLADAGTHSAYRLARLRHGARWSDRSALDHLLRPECGHAERRIAAWEHALVHRAPWPCNVSAFVARQRALLRAASGTMALDGGINTPRS